MKNILEYLLVFVTFLIILLVIVKDFINKENNTEILVLEEAICTKRDISVDEQITKDNIEILKVPQYLLDENYRCDYESYVGKYAKIDIKKNTILSNNYLYVLGETIKEENNIMYHNILLTDDINTNDVVNIKIRINNTEDYIVLNNKKIIKREGNNVWFNLTNLEQQVLLGAIERIGAGSIVYVEKRGDIIE